MKLLIPWESYRPIQDADGTWSPVWGLTHALANKGLGVQVLVPSSTSEIGETFVDGIKVIHKEIGNKFVKGDTPSAEDIRFLDEFDYIFCVQLFGARFLFNSKLANRAVRHVHTVFHSVPLKYTLSLNATIPERIRNYFRMKGMRNLETLLKDAKAICVSKELFDATNRYGLGDSSNVFVAPNSIDIRVFKPMTLEKKYDLLFVGRFYYVKGLDILFRSLLQISQKGYTVKLAVVGKFESRQVDLVQRRIRSTKTQVDFLGEIPNTDIPRAMNSSRLVVIPSRYESFSMVALEAMACGVPVLASSVGALPELVNDDWGRLVEPESVAFSKALVSALKDSELAESSRIAGPNKAQNYSWEKIGTQIASILK